MFHTCLCPFLFSYIFPVFSLENVTGFSQKSAFFEVYETTWSSRPSLRMSRCPTWSRDVERVSRFTFRKVCWKFDFENQVILERFVFQVIISGFSPFQILQRMVCQKWWLWRFWKDRYYPNWKNIGIKRLELLLLVIFVDDKSTPQKLTSKSTSEQISNFVYLPANLITRTYYKSHPFM